MTVLNNAQINKHGYLFDILTVIPVDIYLLKSGIAGNITFSFLKKLQTIFQNGYTNACPLQQCTRVCFSPPPCQHLISFTFW
jgi:hypothetical protein